MKRTTTFTKGSGAYKCTCCGRKTRDDGNRDSVNLRQCSQCYELAGYDNMVADGGELTVGDKANIKQLYGFLVEKGADVEFPALEKAMPELLDPAGQPS